MALVFCAGLDMGNFQTMGGDKDEKPSLIAKKEGAELPGNRAQLREPVWKRLPVPVIAAIHGVAFGGGCQIALGADLRILAPDAIRAGKELLETTWHAEEKTGLELEEELQVGLFARLTALFAATVLHTTASDNVVMRSEDVSAR